MKNGIRFGWLAAFAVWALGGTGDRMSAEQAFQLAETSLALGYSDATVAREIGSVDSSERFTDELIAILRNEGAGPLTVAALDTLRDRSATLPQPAQPPASSRAAPSPSEEQELIRKISQYAASYVHGLPDFVGSETTRFYMNGRPDRAFKKSKQKPEAAWQLDQTITEDLGYWDGAEHYRTRLLNNAPENRPIGKIRGYYSRGQFGQIMDMTFDPASHVRLKWDHWERLHNQRVAVFSYSVSKENSQYNVCCASSGSMTVNGVKQTQYKGWTSAYRGLICAVPETGIIARLTYTSFGIPAWVSLDESGDVLDYSAVTLNDHVYWLPLKAVHHTRTGNFRTRDEIQFSNYRKFTAESTITFR